MPVYEFKCPECSTRIDIVLSIKDWEAFSGQRPTCDRCKRLTRRIFSFNSAPVMQEHFNASVGKPVHSMRQFREELRRKSDSESERLGTTVNLQPIEPDPKALGVTNEGLESTNKVRRSKGLPEVNV